MRHDEHPDDSTLTRELRDSLADLAVPGRPPLGAITSRGRVHRRRRRLAGLGVTGAAACIALALGLTGVFGAPPGRSTGTIQAAGFTLTSYTNGTVALNLRQLFGPAALQQALRREGIPALVMSNTSCSSSPAVTSPVHLGVLFHPPPAGTRHRATPPTGTRHRAAPPGGDQGIIESGNWPVEPGPLAPSIADAIPDGDQPCGDALRDRAVHRLLQPRPHRLLEPHLHRLPHLHGNALEPPGVQQPPPIS